MTTETRVVCDTCGQLYGLFHKECPKPLWVRQSREVSEWRTEAKLGQFPRYEDVHPEKARQIQESNPPRYMDT